MPEKDIPSDEQGFSVEYLYTNDLLQKFTQKLLEYPPIANIEPSGSLQEYLQKVADVIAQLFPFDHLGTGISSVFRQASQLSVVFSLPKEPVRLWTVHDCKLPAAVTLYLLPALAKKHHWPIRTDAILRAKDAHAYVGVFAREAREGETMPFEVPANTYYIVDYQSIMGKAFEGVEPHDQEKYPKLIESGRISVEEEPIAGLVMYDKRYEEAEEEKKNK